MKKIHYLLALVLLIIIITQPSFISLFLSNQYLINLLVAIGYLLIVYPIYSIYRITNANMEEEKRVLNNKNTELHEEIERINESTRNDFIFYKHSLTEAFTFVSDSVSSIIGVSPSEFSSNYKKYKAELLYDNAINRIVDAQNNGIRVPLYEVKLRTKSGARVRFEVRETPIVDDNNELIGLWGTLHYVTSKLDEVDLTVNDSAKYNLIIENINDAVLMIKSDRFVDCNSRALELFNSSVDQLLLYSPFSEKFSPKLQPNGKNSKDEALVRMKLAYEGKKQVFEWRHLKQNGDAFYAKVTLLKYEYKEEVFLLAILKDISSKYEYLEQVKEKEQVTDLLFKQTAISALKFNSDKVVTAYNEAFSKLFQIENNIVDLKVSQILKNIDVSRMLESTDYKKVQTLRTELFKSVKSDKFEAIVKILAINESESELGGMILIEEIDELKELKIDLDNKQKNFEEIISKSQDVIYKYNITDSKYEYISRSINNIFGYSANELSKMNEDELKSIIHPDELYRAGDILAKLFDSRHSAKEKQIEYKIISKKGLVKWVRDSYSIVYNENGTAVSVLGVISDLTSQKESEKFLDHKDKLLYIMTENLSQGITVIIDNKIELVNTNLAEITGYSKEELNNIESLFIYASELEKIRLKDDYVKVISGSSQINELSYWFVKKNGENIFIKNQYFLDAENPQNRYVLTVDITNQLITDYKKNPTEKRRKELETYLIDY